MSVEPKRTLKMFCPTCGWSDIRLSMRHGFFDSLLDLLDLTPYRCNSCNQRFFRFRHARSVIIVPVLLCAALAAVILGGMNSGSWIRRARQSISGSLVKHKPTARPMEIPAKHPIPQ